MDRGLWKIAVLEGIRIPQEVIDDQLSHMGEITTISTANKSRREIIAELQGFNLVIGDKTLTADIDGTLGGTDYAAHHLAEGTFFLLLMTTVSHLSPEILRERKITICHAPGSNAGSVARGIGAYLSWWFTLGCQANLTLRSVPLARRTYNELKGKRVTIIGPGAVGHAVENWAESQEMEVVLCGRNDDKRELVAGADVVVLCVNREPSNKNVFDQEFLAALPVHCVLVAMINRELIDLTAMEVRLRSGRIRAAYLDIGDGAPGDVQNPSYRELVDRQIPNLTLTPQVLHFDEQALSEAWKMTKESLNALMEGGRLERWYPKAS